MRIGASLILRCQRDGLLTRCLTQLTDGSTFKPLMKLSELMPSISVYPLLLPGHFDSLPDDKVSLASETIEKIVVRLNAFIVHDGNTNVSSTGHRESTLAMAISMLNHSHTPNCIMIRPKTKKATYQKSVVFVALKDIAQGDELYLQYHPEGTIVAGKWLQSVGDTT